VAGWLGATGAWLAWPKTPIPWFARIGAVVILALAVALTVMSDLHGPPIFVGAALSAFFLFRRLSG
jgi:hypothetical protein